MTSWLISACIAIIAASLTFGLFLMTALTLNQAALVGIFVFLFLAMGQLFSARGGSSPGLVGRIEDIGETNAKMTREISNLSMRLADLEVSLTHRLEDSVGQRTAPVLTAIDEMRTQLDEVTQDLAATTAALQAMPAEIHNAALSVPNGIDHDSAEGESDHQHLNGVGHQENGATASTAGLAARGLSASQLAELLAMQRDGDADGALLNANDSGHLGTEPPMTNGRNGADHTGRGRTTSAKPVRVGPFADLDGETIAAMVRDAVENGRIELFLQPIVGLPQRKVRYYEASPRLRTDDGDLMMPSDYAFAVAGTALLPAIDATLFVQCVQVTRRLQSRNREIGIFIDIATETLTDDRFSSQFVEFAEHNTAISSAIIFEMAQDEYEDLGPIEFTSLDQLAEHGFRFSLDRVHRLDFDPARLAANKVKFIKINAETLLAGEGGLSRDIHPADLSDLLGRHGIDLIGEDISRESEVVDLIDYDLRLGQGALFSPPRPVRADLLGDRPQFPFERFARANAPKTAPAEPDPVNAPSAR